MKHKLTNYNHDRDFLLVRDFLKENLTVNNKPVNWGLERWNWCRFHPMMFQETDPAQTAKNLKTFDENIRLGLGDNGEIQALVNTELPCDIGVAHFQHSQEGDKFLDALFEYAEENLGDKKSKTIKAYIYDHDTTLQKAAEKHGWKINPDCKDHTAEYPIRNLPIKNLPPGFEISTMAEKGNYAQRCRLNGLGFNHSDPKEWSTPAEYREMQKAPDYHPEFDLFIKTKEGEYVTGCIFWYDDYNKAITFEPVCTIPEYRRKSLGRELLLEGIRRGADLGATRAYVGSSQEFYKAVGFEMKYPDHEWIKEL